MLIQEQHEEEKHNKSSFMIIIFCSVQFNCKSVLIIKSLEKCHYKQIPVFSVSMCMSYWEIYIHSSSSDKWGDTIELIANN